MDIEWKEVGKFFICGKPQAQPRAKGCVVWKPIGPNFKTSMMWMTVQSKAGGRMYPTVRMYTPDTSAVWKQAISFYAGRAVQGREPITGPVRVDIQWHMPRPQRLMRKCDPEGVVLHDVKPDRDNMDKIILDTMTTLGWWHDDCEVAAGELVKFYHAKNGEPGAWVVVSELVVAQAQTELFAEDAA